VVIFFEAKVGKGTSMGSVPIGVESVSNLPFQGPALRVQRLVTPLLPYH